MPALTLEDSSFVQTYLAVCYSCVLISITIGIVMSNASRAMQTPSHEQWLCPVGLEVDKGFPPSALLTATTSVLHFVVTRFKMESRLENLFSPSLCQAWSAFADSLPDKMMLCACLGALHHEMECNNEVCTKTMDLVKREGMHEAIFKALVEVAQVQVQSSVMVMHCNNSVMSAVEGRSV